MKNASVIFGSILLIANICIGLLLTEIRTYSLVVSSITILSMTLLVFLSSTIQLKQAFKISLPFFFIFCGIVEYILSYNVSELKGNGSLIAIVLIILAQILVLLTTFFISKHEN